MYDEKQYNDDQAATERRIAAHERRHREVFEDDMEQARRRAPIYGPIAGQELPYILPQYTEYRERHDDAINMFLVLVCIIMFAVGLWWLGGGQ